jgi:hypothetical protein
MFNIIFAHFMATLILAMSEIDPSNSWKVRISI